MTRRWGQGHEAGDEERETSGRFARSVLCDACGGTIGRWPDAGYTDEDVCGLGDGPGFFLCGRRSCVARRDLGIEDRRALYEAQRAKNEAVMSRQIRPRREKPRPQMPTAACLRVLDAFPVGWDVTTAAIGHAAGCDPEPVIAALVRFGRFAPATTPGLWRRVA